MLKVRGSAAMPGAALSFLPTITVFAASEDGEKDASGAALLLRDQLSLYTGPQVTQTRHEEPDDPGQLEQSIATVRLFAEPYAVWCQGTYGQIKPKVQRVVQFGKDTYAYLKNPPKDFYPRAGIIGFSGVLGLFLARRSRIKRLLYPPGLVALSTSLYYPEQTAAIAKSTGDSVYDRAVQTYLAAEKLIKGPSTSGNDPKEETKP